MKISNERATTANQSAASQKPRAKQRRRIGPYSKLLEHGTISGRTSIGRFVRTLEHQLAQHVGGSPTTVQRMIIRRLAIVSARLELFDQKIASGEQPTEYDARVYGALHNSFRLLCREIGIKGPAEVPGAALRRHIASLPRGSHAA